MTPAEAKKVRARHWRSSRDPHPLEGKSVREWVAEARAGWPKVPVPKDPAKAAERLAKTYGDGIQIEVASAAD